MRNSHSTEILALFLAGISGMIISFLSLFGFIIGGIILALDSYFIMSLLKKQTIQEYIELTQKTGGKDNEI